MAKSKLNKRNSVNGKVGEVDVDGTNWDNGSAWDN